MKTRRKRAQPEAILESMAVEWAWLAHKVILVKMPLELMRFLSDGQKAWYCRRGCQPGFPDHMIFEARGIYHGLMIEFKSLKGKARDNQKIWHAYLNQRNYLVIVCNNFDQAVKLITEYLTYGKINQV